MIQALPSTSSALNISDELKNSKKNIPSKEFCILFIGTSHKQLLVCLF